MRIAWVDAGNDPDYTKAATHQLTGLFFALFESRLTKTYLQAVAAKNYAVGVYAAYDWPQLDGKSPEQIAQIVAARVKTIAGTVLRPSFPKVQFDLEMHDPEFILRVFRRWRQLMPNQDTSWTFEPFQAGWMSPEFVQEIIALRIRVVPQFYLGGMTPAAADMVVRQLLGVGFPDALISGFYDAAVLPYRWDGFAFRQGRLP